MTKESARTGVSSRSRASPRKCHLLIPLHSMRKGGWKKCRGVAKIDTYCFLKVVDCDRISSRFCGF